MSTLQKLLAKKPERPERLRQCHKCFDRAEALSALELEIEDYNRVTDAMDTLSESLNPIGDMT